jgi:hypothetical protein
MLLSFFKGTNHRSEWGQSRKRIHRRMQPPSPVAEALAACRNPSLDTANTHAEPLFASPSYGRGTDLVLASDLGREDLLVNPSSIGSAQG